MIDFRYHLVSLIAIFLALATGVVLGAGPLQNSLGTALNDQVAALRQDRNETQSRLEQTEAAVNDRDDYITAAAASFLPGALEGKKIALAALPDAKSEDVEAVVDQVQVAGGKVDGRLNLTSVWVDESRESFRQDYSGQFTGYLGATTSTDGDGILGEGLAVALTADSPEAKSLMDLLTATGTPLVQVDTKPTGPADMIVVVGPRGAGATADSSDDAAASASPMAHALSWASALTGVASGTTTVVLGSADNDNDVVAALRTAKADVTTIDSVGQVASAVSVPLALASTAAGTRGHYGFDEGASATMPPLQN